jgi:hypothetical protein
MGSMMKDVQRIGPMKNLERRHRGTGQVTEVACRACGARIGIDPRAMQAGPAGHPVQSCPTCGADRQLRLYDWDRVAPAAAGRTASITDVHHARLRRRARR